MTTGTGDFFTEKPLSKTAIRALAALVLFSIVCAALGRYTGFGTSRLDLAPVIESVALKFDDASDGSVVVTQQPGDRMIATLAPGTNGFIRSTVRGLVRTRRLSGIGSETPFMLDRHSNQDLSLRDPTNGRQLELRGFGVTNIGAFEKIMQAAGKNG